VVAAALPFAGLVVPDALRSRRERRRRGDVLAALPDALDLLAVGAAAGRGPRALIGEVARASGGPLAAGLAMTAVELECGSPLSEALAELRARVPIGELGALCAALERSSRFGSPLADQLRRQSAALRRDQRRLVEEHAARAAPKIQLVVALVLVPSVLLMIAAGLIAKAGVLLQGF
jgi:tight adherence protein C